MLLLFLATFVAFLFGAAAAQSPFLFRIMYAIGYKFLRALRLVALGFALIFNIAFLAFVAIFVVPPCLIVYCSIKTFQFLRRPWTHGEEIAGLQQQLAMAEQQLAEKASERKGTENEKHGSTDSGRTLIYQPGMDGWIRQRICGTDEISEIDLDDETVKQGSSGWEGKEEFSRCPECAQKDVSGWLEGKDTMDGKETALCRIANGSGKSRNRATTI